MKIRLSVFACFFLSIEIVEAQTMPLCPDHRLLGYAWKIAGRERVPFIVENEMQLGLDEGAFYIPEIHLELSSFINSRGERICQYRATTPLMSINMGTPEMKPIEDKKKQKTEDLENIKNQNKQNIRNDSTPQTSS